MLSYILFFLFIVLTFLSLRISVYLSMDYNKRIVISPILLFTLLQTFMVNIGLLLSTIEDENYYYKYLIILFSTFFLNLGGLLSGKPKSFPIIKNYNQSIFNKFIILLGYIMVVIILTFLLKDVLIGFIQFIKEIISGNTIGAISSLAKSRSTFSFSGVSNGIVTEFKNIILVFLAIYICSVNFNIYIKVLVIATTIFFLLSTGQRWPIFEALLVCITFFTYCRAIKFNYLKLFSFAFIAYLFFFTISYFSSRFQMTDSFVDNLILNLDSVNYRLFVSQNTTSLYIFKLIPYNLDFGWGEYILRDFSTLLPGYQEGFSTYIYKLTHYGAVGSASFSSLTLFFADFSYFALVLSFLYGFLMQFYSNQIFRNSVSIHRIIFHSFVVIAISTTALGSIAGIITHGLLSGFLLFILLSIVLKITIKNT